MDALIGGGDVARAARASLDDDLHRVLQPQDSSPLPLDCHLPWFLREVLNMKLKVYRLDTFETPHKLTTSFSAMLESLGQWHWAIYVLLTLPRAPEPDVGGGSLWQDGDAAVRL